MISLFKNFHIPLDYEVAYYKRNGNNQNDECTISLQDFNPEMLTNVCPQFTSLQVSSYSICHFDSWTVCQILLNCQIRNRPKTGWMIMQSFQIDVCLLFTQWETKDLPCLSGLLLSFLTPPHSPPKNPSWSSFGWRSKTIPFLLE